MHHRPLVPRPNTDGRNVDGRTRLPHQERAGGARRGVRRLGKMPPDAWATMAEVQLEVDRFLGPPTARVARPPEIPNRNPHLDGLPPHIHDSRDFDHNDPAWERVSARGPDTDKPLRR